MSLQEAFLASHSVMPGSAEARKMTATSGLRCSAALTKSSPLGSCVRMLLESSRWSSRARLLQWQVRPLYSTRTTTFKDTNSERPLPCNESATISRVTDTKSSRFLFRLAVLELRTEGIGSSSSGTEFLPTPTARDEKNPSSPNGERIKRKIAQGGTIELNDLAPMGILPTPSLKTPLHSGTSGTLEKKFNTKMSDLLPTPRCVEIVEDPDKFCERKGDRQNSMPNLASMAASGLLPTPTCNDATNASIPVCQAKRNDSIVKRIVVGSIPTDWTPEDAGGISRLSPLFTEEMMGFPSMWTTLPFLCQDGEMKPSKPTETPSSRK